MRVLRALLIGFGALSVALAAGIGIAWMLTAPADLPEGSESAARYVPGPHTVGLAELVWVDGSRPTAENGENARLSERTFAVALWYPEEAPGPHPLVVYSHGFMSSRHGGVYAAEHLASYGYVVLAADYPLTHMEAPGGPSFLDVVNQPADVSFLIDRATALDGAAKPFEGEIDSERVGVFGLSLGGLTSTVVTFDAKLRDPRVRAAISIAGPADIFGADYFDHADVPFLMIAGTSDAIVDYELNALPILDRIHDGGLVSIAGGTHVGFAQIAAGVMRLLGNPDAFACSLAKRSADAAESEAPKNAFVGLFGTAEQGLLEPTDFRPGCSRTFEHAIEAGRQHMVTTLAVRAFFESHFASETEARAAHTVFLTQTLSAELPEASYAPSRG